MPLYEILIAGFLLPAFFFGWRWTFRIIAAAAAARLIGGMKEAAIKKLKGDAHDNGGQTPV